MQINITQDPDDKQILSIYFRLLRDKVNRTVELSEGVCYIDVDSKGRVLGVEMLAPGPLNITPKSIKHNVDAVSVRGALKQVKEIVGKLEHFVAA